MQTIESRRFDDSMLCHEYPVFAGDKYCGMNPAMNEAASDVFESHRSRLFGVAYRMLRTRADAEDVLQDAYIRWHEATKHYIESPIGSSASGSLEWRDVASS